MSAIDEAKDCLLGHHLGYKCEPEWSLLTTSLVDNLLKEIEKRDAVIEATHNILEFNYNWSVHESNKLSDKALEQALKEK